MVILANGDAKMIASKCVKHGATIQALVEEGKIEPCVAFDAMGKRFVFDSILTFCDWIKESGRDRNEFTVA